MKSAKTPRKSVGIFVPPFTAFASAFFLCSIARSLVVYALPHVDPKGRYTEVEIQSNPATLCTRPGALIEGRAGGAA